MASKISEPWKQEHWENKGMLDTKSMTEKIQKKKSKIKVKTSFKPKKCLKPKKWNMRKIYMSKFGTVQEIKHVDNERNY